MAAEWLVQAGPGSILIIGFVTSRITGTLMTRFGFAVQCAGTAFTVYMLVGDFIAREQMRGQDILLPAPAWTLPVAVALLASTIASLRWDWARMAAALLAAVAVWYGLTIRSTNPPGLLGTSVGNLIVIGSAIVIVGLGIQYWSRRSRLSGQSPIQ